MLASYTTPFPARSLQWEESPQMLRYLCVSDDFFTLASPSALQVRRSRHRQSAVRPASSRELALATLPGPKEGEPVRLPMDEQVDEASLKMQRVMSTRLRKTGSVIGFEIYVGQFIFEHDTSEQRARRRRVPRSQRSS